MTDRETRAFYEILGIIVGTTIEAIDALDETVLALISTQHKLNQEGQISHPETACGESAEIDAVLARMELSEASTEYEKKRWQFQVHLQRLRQIHNELRGLPVSEGDQYVAEVREECCKKLRTVT